MPAPSFDCEGFQALYGFPPEEYLVRVIRGLLHPNPGRWEIDNIDPSDKAANLRDDETRRVAAEEFVAGTRPFERLLPYMGGVSHSIVRNCNPDLDLVLASLK